MCSSSLSRSCRGAHDGGVVGILGRRTSFLRSWLSSCTAPCCYTFRCHGVEELVNDHPGGTSDHSLTETGDGSTGADIARVMKECAGFLRRELNSSFAFDESRSTAAIHCHLKFGGWLQVVQMDRTAED